MYKGQSKCSKTDVRTKSSHLATAEFFFFPKLNENLKGTHFHLRPLLVSF